MTRVTLIMFKFLLALLVAAALAGLYFFLALQWSYSSGERAGWVQKISKKGWLCKTWEGELALVSLPGSAVEKFNFTVHDDEVARRVSQLVGKRVSLHYEEKVGLPTTCFGETRHFITGVTETPDIPLGPGVSIPSHPGAAAPAASVPAPAPVPAPVPAPAPVAPPSPVAAPAPVAPVDVPAPVPTPAPAPGVAPAPAAPAAVTPAAPAPAASR